jgi:hypothetical protein
MARIAHLDIWNTSYGQKKGRELNWQFDSWPWNVKNRPDLLVYKGRATCHWKALDESYNFALDHISIWGLLTKLWGSKFAGVPFGSPGTKKPFGCGYHDNVGWLNQGILCYLGFYALSKNAKNDKKLVFFSSMVVFLVLFIHCCYCSVTLECHN